MTEATARKPEPVAAEPPAPELREQPSEITVKLRKAVIAHGDLVKTLTFREPTGADIMSLGDQYPIIIDWTSGIIRINPAPMGQIMSLLAAVPPSTIRSLKARDWSTCAHALLGFFPPDEEAM